MLKVYARKGYSSSNKSGSTIRALPAELSGENARIKYSALQPPSFASRAG